MLPARLLPLAALLGILGPFSAALRAQEVEILPRGVPVPATRVAEAQVERLDAASDQPFRVLPAAARTTARVVRGGRLRLGAATPDEAARRFLEEHAELFGFDPSWQVTVERKGAGRRAHVAFTAGGLPVDGARAILLQDGAVVVGAAVDVPPLGAVAGGFVLDEARALARARTEVEWLRRRRGLLHAVTWQPPRAARRLLATATGLTPSWLVEERTVRPGEAYALWLDARDGALLRVTDLIDRGTGFYPWGAGFLPFQTTKGEGKVFKNVAAARAGKAAKVTLPDVSKGVDPPASAARGLVVSAYADTWDDNAQDAFNQGLHWNYNPFGAYPEYDNFDQVNTLYEMGKFHKHVRQAVGTPLAIAFSVPVINNVGSDVPNAFFSSQLFPGDGHCNGFIAFFDLTDTLGPAADLARDPTVVDHEYTHGWLFFEGLGFSGALDEPSRAVNEAVADFFAVTHHGDTYIGRYVDDVFPAYGIGRDLQDDDHFPETTVASMALSSTGLPEEHRNGEVFGSFLVDVRNALGGKTAERRLFEAFPYMPRTMADAGILSVTPANAVAATEEFFVQCIEGLVGVCQSAKEQGAVIGAAAARGLINTPSSTYSAVIDLQTYKKGVFTFHGRVVQPGDEHAFGFTASQGKSLKVTAVGAKGSGLLPGFTVTAVSGVPGDVVATAPAKPSKGGRIMVQKGIQLLSPGAANYVVTVTGLAGTTGRYTLKLDV